MKKTMLSLCCCLWLVAPGQSQSVQTTQYAPDDTNFANPERGWHITYEDYPEDFDNRLSKEALLEARQQGVSLVKKRYLLEGLNQQKTVPDWVFKMLQEDFQTVREAGMKIMVQLQYNNEPNGADAPKELILQHIAQLQGVMTDHADVIALVIMGFVGQYGEWVNSSNNLLKMPDMQEIAYATLDALPEDRMISVRFPRDKRQLLEDPDPLPAARAYDGTRRSRIGSHDDCFGSNLVHYGTYFFGESGSTEEDVEKVKDYLSEDNLYLPQGGETCGLCEGATDFFQSCAYALDLLKRLRYSTMSHYEEIDRGASCSTIPTWMAGCQSEIRRKLGYRFTLTSAKVPTQVTGGEELTVALVMSNVGWARPYNPRDVEVVLRSADGPTYRLPVDTPEDARLWLPGPDETETLTAKVALPDDIAPGEYEVLLNLPDPAKQLNTRPAYSIRLANQGTWEAATGYNRLNASVQVESKTVAYEVWARGRQGGERIALRVGGKTMKSWTMRKEYQTYTYRGAEQGPVQVAFVNDQGQDHDVRVDRLTIDGQVYQAEAQAINTGAWQEGSCGGSYSEWLYCGGYVQFETKANARSTNPLAQKSALTDEVASVQVYPNPSPDGSVTVQNASATDQITLYDLQGRSITIATKATGPKELRISPSYPLPRGSYRLYIRRADGTLSNHSLIID